MSEAVAPAGIDVDAFTRAGVAKVVPLVDASELEVRLRYVHSTSPLRTRPPAGA
jgi:hypothetical protein